MLHWAGVSCGVGVPSSVFCYSWLLLQRCVGDHVPRQWLLLCGRLLDVRVLQHIRNLLPVLFFRSIFVRSGILQHFLRLLLTDMHVAVLRAVLLPSR